VAKDSKNTTNVATKETTAKESGAQDGKSKALGLALETIEKQFGKGAIMKMGDSHTQKVE